MLFGNFIFKIDDDDDDAWKKIVQCNDKPLKKVSTFLDVVSLLSEKTWQENNRESVTNDLGLETSLCKSHCLKMSKKPIGDNSQRKLKSW